MYGTHVPCESEYTATLQGEDTIISLRNIMRKFSSEFKFCYFANGKFAQFKFLIIKSLETSL